MRNDASLDHEIKAIEKRIRDRRIALHESWDELGEATTAATQRVRQKAAWPALFAGALVLGFVGARMMRRARAPQRRVRTAWRREKPDSTARQVLGGVMSLALPIALRVAQRQAVPLIARAMRAFSQRRDYNRYRAQH